MDKSKKKLRGLLLLLLVLAITFGIIYVLYGMNEGEIINDGTLITKTLIWRR